MLATAFTPVIGYEEAAKIAKEAFGSGQTIREVARARGFSDEDLDRIIDPARMTEPGLESGTPAGG